MNKSKPKKESCYVVRYSTSGANTFLEKGKIFFPSIHVNLMKISPWSSDIAKAIKKGV